MSDILISNEAIEILGLLYNNSQLPDDVSDDSLAQLKDYGLIIHRIVGHEENPNASSFFRIYPIYETYITEDGKAYFESIQQKNSDVSDQINALNNIAKSLRERVNIAEEDLKLYKQDLEDAKEISKSAVIRSWIAIGISVFAVIVQIIISVSPS